MRVRWTVDAARAPAMTEEPAWLIAFRQLAAEAQQQRSPDARLVAAARRRAARRQPEEPGPAAPPEASA